MLLNGSKYAGTAAPNRVITVADAAALAAVTVANADIGHLFASQTDTGQVWLADSAGTGAGCWTLVNTIPDASTSVKGAIEIATPAEITAATDPLRAITPGQLAAAVATVLDIILGAGGPSVTASLAARAGRQGVTTLLGSSNPPVSPDLAALNVGLSDFSYFIPVRLADYTVRGGLGGKLGANLGWGFNIMAGGYLKLFFGNGANYTTFSYDSSVPLALAAGATVDISGSVAQSLSSTGVFLVGGGGYETAVGILYPPALFNYVLTQAQIVAMMEWGVSATDINNATNTSIIASAFTKLSGTGSISGTSTSGFTGTDALHGIAPLSIPASFVVGTKYRLTYTISGYTSGDVTPALVNIAEDLRSAYGTSRHADGTYTDVLTVTVAGVSPAVIIICDNSCVVSGVSLVPLGALAAYSDTQPGIGPQMRDVSGNNAHINLPGDGITGGAVWAHPSRNGGSFGTTRTTSGYIIADQLVIPPGCAVRVWAKGDGGTFSLGDTSAAPNTVVDGKAAPADLTPIVQTGYTTANRKLYLTLGSAATVTLLVELIAA